jgi:hypothetical protein
MNDPAAPLVAGTTILAKFDEALNSGSCPVCHILRHDEFEELCRWVGGDVTEPKNRQELEAAGGFCNRHLWLLGKIHSPCSASLVNDFVVEQAVTALRDTTAAIGSAPARWLRESAVRCPLCVHLRAYEASYVSAFTQWLHGDGAWPRYAESRGLCQPHLQHCLNAMGGSALRQRLLENQVHQFRRLQTEMRAYAEKFSAGRRWDIAGSEEVAWEQAIEKLVGRAGIALPDEAGGQP